MATGTDTAPSLEDLEPFRRELTGYCYRMLGSAFEADDAVQETMVRAWKAIDGFEGRSSLRSWVYRIATNVCLDALRSRQRRARPMDMGPSSTTAEANLPASLRPENTWIEPMPDDRVLPATADPAELAAARETIRLAFVSALQHLPARQRAVLILREVLRWQATEVAELLDTTVASVNSALQRARATMAGLDLAEPDARSLGEDQQALLARYVDAFERYDVTELVTLLRDDVVLSMPPFSLWLRGKVEFSRWFLGPGIGCKGSKLVPLSANGSPAFASYKPDGQGGRAAWAIQVLELDGDRITGHHNFLDTKLFAYFGLPDRL